MQRLHQPLVYVALLLLAAITISPARAAVSRAAAVTRPAHLVIIFMENRSASAVIGNSSAPYLNAFYKEGVRFTNYKEGSTKGPSLPDYLQVASGSSCGKTGDSVVAGDKSIASAGCTTTVWNQLQTAGKSWGVYEDAMPSACSSDVTYNNKALDTQYALKHNPATPFPAISSNRTLCRAHVLPYSSFRTTAMAAVSFIAPGICNDQHGASATTYRNCATGSAALMKRGDEWLSTRVPPMLSHGATVFITYDESGTLYAAEVGPGITANTRNATPFTHYSLLAAIEQSYGFSRLHSAASATPIPL